MGGFSHKKGVTNTEFVLLNLQGLPPEPIPARLKGNKPLITLLFRVIPDIVTDSDAGWSSLAARRAHNPKVIGSNPIPATKYHKASKAIRFRSFFITRGYVGAN